MVALNILVVDDDDDIRSVLRQVLREEGFSVREARNGLEALERIGEEEPDLVLLDLLMPVMDGQGVIDMLRSAQRDLPIVVFTASGVAVNGIVTAYLQKPLSLDRLLDVLEGVRARLTPKEPST
jgi:CheY-like chemotaxis protein